MSHIKAFYHNRNPGGYWFEPDTMRFFKTRMGSEFYAGTPNPDGPFEPLGGDWERCPMVFVTSEKPPHGPRAYSVRWLDSGGDISTVGPFCVWTRSVANRVARDIAYKGKATVDGEIFTAPAFSGVER